VSLVALDAYDASIEVVSGETLAVATHVEWTSRNNRPILHHELQQDTLILSSACDPVARGCVLRHVITLPRAVELHMLIDNSEVSVTGAVGPITGEITNGSIDLAATGEALDLMVANTGIAGASLRSSDIQITSTGGAVSIDFASPPTNVDISAHDTVVLSIPPAAYDLDLTSDFGTVQGNLVEDVDGASRRITVRTRVGFVNISPR
jgi:hypothetical protein